MKSATRSDQDTISNLPSNIVDRILGCLPLKYAVRTSILSKDWRYRWATRQELEFDYDVFKSFACHQEAKGIIYQVLLLHKGPLLKFSLTGPDLRRSPDIDHWIHFLSKKNVQEFTLRMGLGRYHLPSNFFTFHQLRHLEVCGCSFRPPPSFKGFEQLISLDLEHVTFVLETFRNFISRCPSLERLKLTCCTDIDYIEVDAANIKCFEFHGSSSIFFKNSLLLEKVAMHLYGPRLADCCNLTKFFHHMPSLQELDLSCVMLEYLTNGVLLENPPTALKNVKSLCISSTLFRNVEEVSGVFYFITSCPKLQKLTIEWINVFYAVEPVVQFLRAQSVSCVGLKQLKRVIMNMFCGHEMEMEFVRFILASAPLLEEIYCCNYASRFFCRPGAEITDEMKQFHRVSSISSITKKPPQFQNLPVEWPQC